MRSSLAVASCLVLGTAPTLPAQPVPDADLVAIERYLAVHRYADARRHLARWWEVAGDTVGGERRARALHLRAILAEDMEHAERDLLRVAVEHPQSALAAGALFRVAQLRLARRDSMAAGIMLERLASDHPQSSYRERALALLGSLQAAGSASAHLPAAPPTPAAAPARRSTEFVVQVGSFPTLSRAEALRDSLRATGVEAFLARAGGSRDTLVRTGPLHDRGAAESLVRRLRSVGYRAEVVMTGGS